MEIKFNKGFSILLIIILILIFVFGQTLILSFIDFVRLDSHYELSTLDILITSLTSIFDHLPNLVIGIWLFAIVNKFQEDKWSWFLIGLAFGQYSLIFLAIILIVQGIKLKVDLNKALRPVLILMIISFFLNPASSFIIRPYLTRILNATDYGILTEYNSYLSFFNYGIVILLNIILSVKLYNLIGQLQIKGKFLWTISTVFLGLFPVILFNELIITKIDNNNAA
jgi:hypothetical protein